MQTDQGSFEQEMDIQIPDANLAPKPPNLPIEASNPTEAFRTLAQVLQNILFNTFKNT